MGLTSGAIKQRMNYIEALTNIIFDTFFEIWAANLYLYNSDVAKLIADNVFEYNPSGPHRHIDKELLTVILDQVDEQQSKEGKRLGKRALAAHIAEIYHKELMEYEFDVEHKTSESSIKA